VEKRLAGEAQSIWRLATGWTVWGIQVGARFSAPFQNGPGTNPASCTMDTGCSPRVKRLGCDVDHPPPSNAEVKEELYLYSTGLSWSFTGRTLPLPLLEKSQTCIPTYLCIGMYYLFVLHEGEMGEWSYGSIYS
jgi:hypothetical protein